MPRIGSSRDFLPMDEMELPEDGELYTFRLVAVQKPKMKKSIFTDEKTGEFKEREEIECEFVIDAGDHEGFRLREWFGYSVYDPGETGLGRRAHLSYVMEALAGRNLDDLMDDTAALAALLGRPVEDDEEISIHEMMQALAENQARMRALLIHTTRKRDGRTFAHIKADTAKKLKGNPTAPLSKKSKPAPQPEEDDDDAASLFDDGLGVVA